MKKILILLIFFCNDAIATFNQTMYVAARGGLNVREKPEANSTIITQLVYGQEVVIRLEYTETAIINGFKTRWVLVNHGKGANGYIVEAYLLPMPPPSLPDADFKQYAEQLSEAIVPSTIYQEINDLEQNLKDEKTLYKNGMVLTIHSNYEYLSESLIIPGITIQQAFIIAQNLSPINELLPQNGEFPQENTSNKEGGNYRITELLYSQSIDNRHRRPKSISFAVDNNEIMGTLSLVELNGQVAIIYEYGS